jgi:isochorismate synthase
MNSNFTITQERSTQKSYQNRSIIGYALATGDSVALWRLPNQSTYQLLLSKSAATMESDRALEELPAGFLVAPFLPSSPGTYLPADYLFRIENNQLLPPANSLEAHSHAWLQQQSLKPADIVPFHINNNAPITSPRDNDFMALIEQGIELIQTGRCEKIVPSRSKHIAADIDPLDAFEKLCASYPTAMVNLISVPSLGTWVGATPEVLVTVENQQTFRTVALAGTKPWQEGTDLRTVAWTQKEIEEQALVERYIISCFKTIRLREYEEHGPKTIVAGNLMHLKSDFTVDMKAVNFPQLGSVMLKLLHPTSAVCGMPLEPALQFLQQHEGYNRELYSGYLGPVNVDKNTNLFVNLRCMQLQKNGAILYAGAGVTADSIPEKEWEETEMKMKTLLAVLG